MACYVHPCPPPNCAHATPYMSIRFVKVIVAKPEKRRPFHGFKLFTKPCNEMASSTASKLKVNSCFFEVTILRILYVLLKTRKYDNFVNFVEIDSSVIFKVLLYISL